MVDISNIEKPRSVAFYQLEHGGVHNVWVAGDSLYIGAYNLAVTRDGTKLIATNKRDQSVSVFDTKSGAELARMKTTKRVVRGERRRGAASRWRGRVEDGAVGHR